jgi:hypothetical protein
MTDRTEAHIPDNWASFDYNDQVTRELLALLADQETLDAVLVRRMLAEAWAVGYTRGAEPGWDAPNPFADN